MKKLIFITLFYVSINSFSQEFKLNYENLENLEILSIEFEMNNFTKEGEKLKAFYLTKEKEMDKALTDKVEKYTKEQRRTRTDINIKRVEEVKQQNSELVLFRKNALEDIENKYYNGSITMLTEISKRENCAVIITEDFNNTRNVYLDRQRKPLIIYNKRPLLNQAETTIRAFFDVVGTNQIEGIWRSQNQSLKDNFKLIIIKENIYYNAYILPLNGNVSERKLKARIEFTSYDNIASIEWILENEKGRINTVGTIKNKSLIEFNLSEKTLLYKLYPNSPRSVNKPTKKNEWAGNGSGVIISKSGHIITNHHVIEDAEDIEVEFMLDDELQKFNAEVVQVDKTNDLAVLKIFDMNFDGVSEPPYNFKFRGSDVGTKVYAFGYPMALTVMGKEIKVTDGMISSKTGFDGNITTYQITAPIQGGNSGGPLFDEQANLIGINSSGIRKDIADNVAYSIKTSYVSNLLDVLPKSIELPSSTKLKSLPLTEQIKEISKYVVLVKVK